MTFSARPVLTHPDGDKSGAQARGHVTLRAQDVVLECAAWLPADGTAEEAGQLCRDVVQDYTDTLAGLPADAGEPVVAPETLAAALPADDELPQGTKVTTRCPGDDSSCDSILEKNDAYLNAAFPAPEGAGGIGSLDGTILRSWVTPREKAALAEVEKLRQADVGTVDTKAQPGIPAQSGAADVEDVKVDGWTGATRVFEGTWQRQGEDPTGPLYEIQTTVTRGRVVVTTDTTYLAEGRTRAEAEQEAREQLEQYLADIDAERVASTPG